MEKNLGFFAALLCIFLLASCRTRVEAVFRETATAPAPAPETTAAQTLPPETIPVEAPPVPTEPEHSPLYLPGVPVEDMILWFNEICLDAEFTDSGNPSVLQKWQVPICYTVQGSWTEEDMAVLCSFCAWLNTIEGFPGIREAGEGDTANLRIHFCGAPELTTMMGEAFYGLDGAVRFWYDFDAIYDAVICCRSDISQYTRNSVILEELYNGLGPIQDTDLRPDSICYSGFTEPQQLTQLDERILQLLYHPDMHCGMDAEQCAAVIRKLYH